MQPVHPMSDRELDAHVADLKENGYVILREQIAPEYLDPLRDIAQRAADDYIGEPPADRVAKLRTDWRVMPRREKTYFIQSKENRNG